MDLVQLQMFCHVAETGSIVRTAELMQRVPSNVTTRVHQLEEEFKTTLFIREKQRLRLSPMGHIFLGYARRILSLSDEMMNLTHTGEPTGHFALGAMESTAATVLPALLATYHQTYPNVDVSLSIGHATEITEQLRAGTLAAALVDDPLQHDDLGRCVAFQDHIVMISSLQHADIQQATDAKDEVIYVFQPQLTQQLRLDSWFRRAQCAPAKIVEMTSYNTMITNVASGSGLAVLPYKVLKQLPAQSLVKAHTLPADIAENTTWLMWRHDAFNANIRALKELIIHQSAAIEAA